MAQGLPPSAAGSSQGHGPTTQSNTGAGMLAYPSSAYASAQTTPYSAISWQHFQPTHMVPPAAFQQQFISYAPVANPHHTLPALKIRAPVSLSPSPSPPPRSACAHWDTALKTFFESAGLSQALGGFERDMLVLNEDWERGRVFKALDRLREDLADLQKVPDRMEQSGEDVEKTLAERKLDYVQLRDGITPQTPSSLTKTISQFLAKNRARNDASNRAEFLRTFASSNPSSSDPGSPSTSSSARTNARTLDRERQMKYDIARNDEGPLRRTVKAEPADVEMTLADAGENTEGRTVKTYEPTAERHPGLDGRLRDLETHLAVRYVPAPPRALLDRIRFLEDHIVKLEKDYPPWAALHFNQPHRGWPPPPRQTPIIVPSHLMSHNSEPAHDVAASETRSAFSLAEVHTLPDGPPPPSVSAKGKAKASRAKSSLHRAVMEKLEVQKAMSDLAGGVSNKPVL